MSEIIFLTGGTGFVGTELASRFLDVPEARIYVLVRAKDEDEAYHRLKGSWYHDKPLYKAIGSQVIPVPGDFTVEDLGITDNWREKLKKEITLVVHAGADVGLQKSRDDLLRTNAQGTQNVILFAKEAQVLRRFLYLSTAYVAGTRSGTVMESDEPADSFTSYYEESKGKAENLVRESGLPYSICRPGMIIGDSDTGWVRNFNTVYYVLKRMLLGKTPVFPVDRDTALNLVPVNYVADSIVKICFDDRAEGKTFHLTCPENLAPKSGELEAFVRNWASQELGTELPKAMFIPMPFLKKVGDRYSRKEGKKQKSTFTNLLALMPYFFDDKRFDRTNSDDVCGNFDFNWKEYMDVLLRFACRKNFMRQTGQTVFEQAMVRRESNRYPVHYYDVKESGIFEVSGHEVNVRIRDVENALWNWGVRKGDRVALTGINSVDYLVLEQAIGLIGAVSVPIYYTTPASETSLLLDRSGAKWFFVGDLRMMKQIPDVETKADIISFSVAKDVCAERIRPWNEFMEKAKGPSPDSFADPEDLATIRYTSGTTGEPKGVMFNFGQLAWMGEVLTNLLPWKERNRSMKYLSFLPLSHVVEGILASYAPYYALMDVHYYYLNDFGALTDSLPKVRPNVFFSVPRFYEKVWDRVVQNPLGKVWMRMKPGVLRNVVGTILRKAVLKKAGIDQCKQLIVGSAPISEALLLHFRDLGIEIHNAYGQTEAPLITINRLGDNVIPTIGTPLPETEVTAEEDGELIVTGPQVTLGYYGLDSPSIRDGVLRTGDLGTIGDDGHITLFGRKKDFVVTAYGKNISITKLEEKLKDIPGVSEAVLIGESRPYCTALLWTEGEVADLDSRIAVMNATLSHPEQIRKYCTVTRPLSIQAEELTPNLKVKRGNVMKHFKKEIEEMYS